MAHELEIINDEASMMYYGEVPWHGLGTKLDNPATAEEALRIAKLNFNILKVPAFCQLNGKNIEMTGRNAVVREDTMKYLGDVGSKYQVIQNVELFSFFDPIIDRDEAIYHTAGVIQDGRKVWLLAKLPEHIKVKDEVIDRYVLLYSAHDGSSQIVGKFTPIRVVCNNTLQMALAGNNEMEVKIKHTISAHEKLLNAHKILQITNGLTEQLNQIFSQMSDVKMKGNMLDDYLAMVFPGTVNPETNELSTRTSNTREKVRELVTVGLGMDSEAAKGTLWGAYNAVVEYADHVKFDEENTPDERTNSIWFGSSKQLTEQAFEHAVKFLN